MSNNVVIDLNDHPDMRVPRTRKSARVRPGKLSKELEEVVNAYCPTGDGGGLDNSCGPHAKDDTDSKEEKPFTGSGTGTTKKDPINVGKSVKRGIQELKKGNYVHVEGGKKVATKLLDKMAETGDILSPEWDGIINRFCPTGEGGGVDPTCGNDDVGGSSSDSGKKEIKGVEVTPPPPSSRGMPVHRPNVAADSNKDGVTDAARVGVPAMSVPPPPPIGHLPNLTPHEREVERKFIDHYEANPDQVANDFRDIVKSAGYPPTFGTDDAKVLADAWSHPDIETRLENRATLNNALHQTANAICKRAFLQELDTLKEGSEILVTVGGCGAGKGYALKNVPEALAMKSSASVIWDSAGDQNATENPWIQQEAEARGLKVNYVFVHAEPESQWAHPERGVVKRADDPKDGRMVDAKVYADSYSIGARNHQNFYEKNKDNPNAKFVFLENSGKPKLIPGIPKEALEVDRKKLAEFASKTVKESSAPERIKKGATQGERIWQHI